MKNKKLKIKNVRIVILLIIFALCVCSAAITKETGKKEEKKDAVNKKIVVKEIQGEVTWVGKDKISVLYEEDKETGGEYEILLPFEKDKIELLNKKNLKELKIGDMVSVQYEEITDEAKERPRVDFKAKRIKFVRVNESSALLKKQEPQNEEP